MPNSLSTVANISLIISVTLIAFSLASQQIAATLLRNSGHPFHQSANYGFQPRAFSTTRYRSAKINENFINKRTDHDKEATSTLNNNKYSKNFDNNKGVQIFNRLMMESFIEPTFLAETINSRAGRRKVFSEIPTTITRVVRGLTNFTVTIGRTINSENVNGSLSRLITNRLVGVSESLMGWVERSVDDLPSIPRLDAQECMKRSICEAHNQPKKYGAVGLIIQLFFPPYLDAEDASKIVSKYQLAARYGRGENANCSAQYDGCMVNILDVLQGAINMIF